MTFANTLKYFLWRPVLISATCLAWPELRSFYNSCLCCPNKSCSPNLMTDFPELNIASDNVDQEMVMQPRRWNIRFIQQFMLTFGILSSVFDYLTFGALLWLLHASETQFRTGWFMESVISASLIVLVIRSRRPLFKSGRVNICSWLLY